MSLSPPSGVLPEWLLKEDSFGGSLAIAIMWYHNSVTTDKVLMSMSFGVNIKNESIDMPMVF